MSSVKISMLKELLGILEVVKKMVAFANYYNPIGTQHTHYVVFKCCLPYALSIVLMGWAI